MVFYNSLKPEKTRQFAYRVLVATVAGACLYKSSGSVLNFWFLSFVLCIPLFIREFSTPFWRYKLNSKLSLLVLISFIFQAIFSKTELAEHMNQYKVVLPWGMFLVGAIFFSRGECQVFVRLKRSVVFWFCVANIAGSIFNLIFAPDSELLRALKNIIIFVFPMLFLYLGGTRTYRVLIRIGVFIASVALVIYCLGGFEKPNMKPLFGEMSWTSEFLLVILVLEISSQPKKFTLNAVIILGALFFLSSMVSIASAALVICYVFREKIKNNPYIFSCLIVFFATILIGESDRVVRMLEEEIDRSALGRLELYQFLFDPRTYLVDSLPQAFGGENLIHFSGGVGYGPLGTSYLAQAVYLYGWIFGYTLFGFLVFMTLYFVVKTREAAACLSLCLLVNSLAHPIFTGVNSCIFLWLMMRQEIEDQPFKRQDTCWRWPVFYFNNFFKVFK